MRGHGEPGSPPRPQARRSQQAGPTRETCLDAPHGHAAAQDPRHLPPLPRGHPRRSGYQAIPDMTTGEQGAGKLASPVREETDGKGPGQGHLAGGRLHAEGGPRETAGGNTGTAPAGLPYEDALIKISAVASTIGTLSVRDMIEALIGGERDPKMLADLARGKMKAKRAALIEALTGRFDDHHAELARMLLDQVDALSAQIGKLTARIEELIAAIPAAQGVNADGTTGPQAGTGPAAPVLPAVNRLDEVTGIGRESAQALIAEIGLHMSVFPTAAHLVSWVKICPRTIQSGARSRAGRTGKGNPYIKGILGEAAAAAGKTDTFLGERYRRLARRRGKLKA